MGNKVRKSAYNFLLRNKDENILLEYIYYLLNKNKEMSIEDIAFHSFMSKSSISRYFQQNGFDGFSEFKFLLHHESKELETINDLDAFENEMIINPIKITSSLNDLEKFEHIYNLVKEANLNFILGAGANFTVCYELKTRLDRFGFFAETSSDLHGFYASISKGTEKDILWVFSYTGETKEVISIAKKAKKNEMKIISITRGPNNSIANLSDCCLFVDDSESFVRTLSIKSRISMFYLVSKIVLFIYSKDPKKFELKLLDSLYN